VSGFLGGGIGPRAFGGTGLLDPVPVAGAELLTNGDMEDNSEWLAFNSPTITEQSSAQKFDGIYSWRIVSAGGYRGARCSYKSWPNGWLFFSWHVYRVSGSVSFHSYIDNDASTAIGVQHGVTTIGAWGQVVFSGLSTKTGSSGYCMARDYGTAAEFFIDDVSAVPLTLSSLLSIRPYASANCDISAAVTRTAATQAGLCARLDSASSPANFIIAYESGGGRVRVDKCVAGVYTNVIDGAITYAAGRVLRLVCTGNDVSCYYNGVQVGSTVTVSDAGIVSNTRHGKFSTYASNTLAGYVAA
jgi:hypothetical protein